MFVLGEAERAAIVEMADLCECAMRDEQRACDAHDMETAVAMAVLAERASAVAFSVAAASSRAGAAA